MGRMKAYTYSYRSADGFDSPGALIERRRRIRVYSWLYSLAARYPMVLGVLRKFVAKVRHILSPGDATRSTALLAYATVLLVAAGCASQAVGDPSDPNGSLEWVEADLDLDPPENGFQIEIPGSMIESGDDIEWCEVVELPGRPTDVYYVNSIEAAMTGYGHYLRVSAMLPGSETEANAAVGDRVLCQRAGEVFGEELTDVINTQHLYDEVRFPEGVGKVFWGGQKVVIDHHYYNDSEEAVPAKVKINFHLAAAEEIRTIAHTAAFENLTIYTPPNGESSHLGECSVTRGILVSGLARQTNRWGTSFTVWFSGGRRDGERIWTSTQWDRDTRYEFPDGPVALEPGEGFRFQCDYRNPMDEELQFGVNATDEVCVLHPTYWSAYEGEEVEDQSCLLFFVGEDGIARKEE